MLIGAPLEDLTPSNNILFRVKRPMWEAILLYRRGNVLIFEARSFVAWLFARSRLSLPEGGDHANEPIKVVYPVNGRTWR